MSPFAVPAPPDYTMWMSRLEETSAGELGFRHFSMNVARKGRAEAIYDMRFTQLERSKMRGRFLELMRYQLGHTHSFGEVFDNRGHIRPWLVENEYYKGTGCWGSEIDEGYLMHIWDHELSSDVSVVFRVVVHYTDHMPIVAISSRPMPCRSCRKSFQASTISSLWNHYPRMRRCFTAR